ALPMGVGGTIRWLETLGRALDREDAARRLIRAELEPLLPTLERVRDRFLEGRRLAISAEPALAAGLFAVADELGLQVPLILAQTRHEERLGCVREAIAASRQRPLLLLDRGPLELETALRAFEEGRGAELLIGASPDRDTAANLGLEFLEVGFPSFLQHALFAKPLLGFAGMRRLADELVNAVQRLDYARNRARASAESA
ncbi:MAG: nitrogenase component 1, partial [Myxococcales bacterium]|nr:nitrogenase component 1 [Myxococcales bacterium]